MPPHTIILIRHAQAEHNISQNYTLPDPPLSPLGLRQLPHLTHALRTSPLAAQITTLLTSPATRTLQTTQAVLAALPTPHAVTLELRPEWQENSAMPCDTPSLASVLRPRFPSLASPPWETDPWAPLMAAGEYTSKTGPWAPDAAALRERARLVLGDLGSREGTVGVVAHQGFLQVVTGEGGGGEGVRWENGEGKAFGLEVGSESDGSVRLVPKEGGWVLPDAEEGGNQPAEREAEAAVEEVS
ncbi:phosphoglycerate mutase-like protein [Trichodelitschia bisporula]|uniref:Phosphoglycerate mutase-like protein n=1 Tax=Trichodelitschia bisporula TaxID=703511 RepID=A0A6G1IBL3_9PEZI|nr:phosphoglycerate mutase-like protein [Trichodelitschia bisporula]